ncbi:MAG: MarR family winged helix-turn-helix transcriptional regulator [Flavobacteriaceae bacterium]|nr:MarR family winged helix-turn-helix transcriptional regulator [Flavobacteriaceae bacterium]
MDFSQTYQVLHSIENALKSYKRVAQQNIRTIDDTITVDQMSLLQQIKNNPNTPQSQLAAALLKDYAAITRMVDLLVKNKYIKRKGNEYDRRRNTLLLTDKGEKALKKLKSVLKTNHEIAMKNFSNYELDRLDKLLQRLIVNCS